MDIKNKIINLDDRDYHIHSSNYSDGMPTINEIVEFAGQIGLKEIAITDHSQATIDCFRKDYNFTASPTARFSLKNWGNIYNDVNVIFGVEADLLNEYGDVCFDIQGKESDFNILSAHIDIFKGNPNNVTDAHIKAIEKYHEKINLIGHPCANNEFGEYIDIRRLVEVANKYDIPLEFNAQNLYKKTTNLEKLDYLLKNTNKIYLNSDAHSLIQLRDFRKNAIKYLKDNKYI